MCPFHAVLCHNLKHTPDMQFKMIVRDCRVGNFGGASHQSDRIMLRRSQLLKPSMELLTLFLTDTDPCVHDSLHWGLNPGTSVYRADALPLIYKGLMCSCEKRTPCHSLPLLQRLASTSPDCHKPMPYPLGHMGPLQQYRPIASQPTPRHI